LNNYIDDLITLSNYVGVAMDTLIANAIGNTPKPYTLTPIIMGNYSK
jgi:hypothetical protein